MASDLKLSNPLKVKIVETIQDRRTIKAKTITELKEQFGLGDVSDTQFRRALSSLHFSDGLVHVARLHDRLSTPRSYTVSCVDLALWVKRHGRISFEIFKPDGVPGYKSTIAREMGLNDSHIARLLAEYDWLKDHAAFRVKSEPLRELSVDREVRPAWYRITITPRQ